VKREQLLAESEVFQNHILTGTEGVDNPTERMANPQDHGRYSIEGLRNVCCASNTFHARAKF